jgi:hypothetical protein
MRTTLIVVGCVFATISPVAAQTPYVFVAPLTSEIISGTYAPLTTWDSVKLGAAYFTDPKRVKSTLFAYEYDPAVFDSPEQQANLGHLASSGSISCVSTDQTGAAPSVTVPCNKIPDFPSSSASFRIISAKSSLLDKKPSNVLVYQNNASGDLLDSTHTK